MRYVGDFAVEKISCVHSDVDKLVENNSTSCYLGVNFLIASPLMVLESRRNLKITILFPFQLYYNIRIVMPVLERTPKHLVERNMWELDDCNKPISKLSK